MKNDEIGGWLMVIIAFIAVVATACVIAVTIVGIIKGYI